MTPPKSSKSEWDKIHGDLIKAAFRGIGACADEDAEKVNMYFGEAGALVQKGHSKFQ